MADFDEIELEADIDEYGVEMSEDIFEEQTDFDFEEDMVQEETDHNDDDRQIRDEIVRQTVGSHILDEEEETSREIINCQVRRSNAILTRENFSSDRMLDEHDEDCEERFTDSDNDHVGEVEETLDSPVEAFPPRSQVQRITLRRNRETGYGFRPAGCLNMQPIVASVRANSSAARHGLRMGDRIHSIITPKQHLQISDPASMLAEFRNGPQTFHQIHSVQQIKEVLGGCRSYVTLCIIRDMEQIDTDIEVAPLTPLGLGLQSTNLGIFVTSVQPGSVGDIFGYRFGDQILSINEQPVYSSDDIRRVRRKALREMEVKKAKKKSSLFRSVSSLSTSSRRQQSETEASTSDRPLLERIRLSVGRRAVEDYSNHPIAEIWNENENRQSPTNILEPVFDEPTVKPTAPSVVPSDEELPQAVSENNEPNNETFSSPGPSQRSNEEQELIDALKSSSISPRPSLTKISAPFENTDEPYLLEQPKPSLPTSPTTKSKSTTADQETKCVICLEGTKEIVFLPCWHLISCAECAVRLKECPVCREVIALRRRPYRC